ncbi:hypothetical protein HAX54_014825 [Datura stramonium]|uniref:MAM domain-containing protein n=1 Tax=Datura stramonium TaxID=4076 RepID=A0ABS8TNN8_DATST|nr:hypothetical protein [Datura stramonium]
MTIHVENELGNTSLLRDERLVSECWKNRGCQWSRATAYGSTAVAIEFPLWQDLGSGQVTTTAWPGQNIGKSRWLSPSADNVNQYVWCTGTTLSMPFGCEVVSFYLVKFIPSRALVPV